MRKWYGIILSYYFLLLFMGFFDSIVEDSTSAATSTAATQGTSVVADSSADAPLIVSDSSVSFDSSDLVILDDTPSVSISTSETVSEIPDTVGEMFLTSENNAVESVTSGVSNSEEIAPEVVIQEAPEVTDISAINESVAVLEDVAVSESAATIDFSSPSIEAAPASQSVEAAPALGDSLSFEAVPMAELSVSAANDEVIDIDATLKKTIAELESNAQKIQTKADEAFARESELLEEKSRREAEHKAEMKKLQQAAQDARKSGEEIKKSGDRTNELIKLLQAQVAA